YHHLIHYRPAFIAGISVLGLQSVALTLAALLWPLAPTSAPWIFGLWGVKLAIESYGMWLGTRQLDRRDLWPASALVWALLHPAFISTSLVWSLVRPGDWRAGAARYRSRYLKRQLQQLGRRVRAGRLRS